MAVFPAVHRTIIAVDVARFSDPHRDLSDKFAIRQGMHEVLKTAFAEADIDFDACELEDRGDGALILVPPSVSKSMLADRLPDRLVAALRRYNSTRQPQAQFRLRASFHAGDLLRDDHGFVGPAVNVAFRILDSPEAKSELSRSKGQIALIASDWFYNEVIAHDAGTAPEAYRRISVSVKTFTGEAWLRLMGRSETDQPVPTVDDIDPLELNAFVGLEYLWGLLDHVTVPNLALLVRRVAGPAIPVNRPNSVREAFEYLADFNAGPDGIPPALVFLDLLANEVGGQVGAEVRTWVTDQARRLRLEPALEARRGARAHRTIVVADIEGFDDRRRSTQDQVVASDNLYQSLQDAFTRSGIPWDECLREDRGDGIVILIPSDRPKSLLVENFPRALIDALHANNARKPPAARIRLRVALHAGEVHFDDYGISGPALNLAFRLLDAPQLKSAMAESPGVLGLITSDWFYNEVVRHTTSAEPLSYVPAPVSVLDTTTTAWICLPDAPEPTHGVTAPRSDMSDFVVSSTAADRAWAEWISWQLREAGYTVDLDVWGFVAGDNFVDQMADTSDRAHRVILVLSPEFQRLTRTMSEVAAVLRDREQPVVSVRVGEVDVEDIGDVPVVDIVGAGAETARQRLLAAAAGHREPRQAPAFPGGPPLPEESPPTFPNERRRTLVVAHADADAAFATQLVDALRVLESENVLSHVESATVDLIESRPTTAARTADIVVLVVSRNLLNTRYGTSHEMRVILNRHNDRETTLVPVVFRSASWKGQPYGHLTPLPTGDEPVSRWPSRDEAIENIVDGVRLIARPPAHELRALPASARRVSELGEVFKSTGVPTLTFVEPDDYFEFKMALRQPGLGIVLEGPSGIGKTTLLRRAVNEDAAMLGEVTILSARKRADLPEIDRLLDGHTGTAAVDDFQRLDQDRQDQLTGYLKLLADDEDSPGKLVIIGIPGTAKSLVEFNSDIATRIQVFRLGRVNDKLLLQMIGKGEDALNIRFDRKAEIAHTSAGSLLTAQMLCAHQAMMAGIERTVTPPAVVRTDVVKARAKVTERLHLKYQPAVEHFVSLDGPTEHLCIELLLGLAKSDDGTLPLEQASQSFEDTINRVLPHGLTNHPTIAECLFYDPRGRRLVVDDPQFVFYLRQLNRDRLMEIAGKRLPVERDHIFVCYTQADARWLKRLQVHLRPLERDGVVELWSDRRIEAGDLWCKEIASALDRAKAALLLISADFFASDFIHSEELPPLLAAADRGGCLVIPVLTAPSLFDQTPALSCYQSRPIGKTLSELQHEDAEAALVELTLSLQRHFKD